VTIQNPASEYKTVRGALWGIYQEKGVRGLFHGTSVRTSLGPRLWDPLGELS
jgi:hypothetical protein